MITATNGFQYNGKDVGWRYVRPIDIDLPADLYTGTAVAVVMDGYVVDTFATFNPIWDALSTCTIVDVTGNYTVDEGHAVINLVKDDEVVMTLHINKEILAAALTSNPVLVKMTMEHLGCRPGWRYVDGVLRV